MKLIRSDGIKTLRTHPEEPCEARRLEGSTLARPCLWPSFETRARARLFDDIDMIRISEKLHLEADRGGIHRHGSTRAYMKAVTSRWGRPAVFCAILRNSPFFAV